MSDTPRTDSFGNQFVKPGTDDPMLIDEWADFARALERELADANRRLSDEIRDAGALANAAGKAFDKGLDNDELRAALSAWAQREAPK